MCYTSLFYLITIFQMNLIIAGLHLPHRVSRPKNMEEQTCRNKKWHNVPMEGILSSFPWITDCFLSLWITFYTFFCFSPSIIINTLATYTLESHGVFSVFQILFQNPSPGSKSWNVTILLGRKTLKKTALVEIKLRLIAMMHELWGSAEKNHEQSWDFNKYSSSLILS